VIGPESAGRGITFRIAASTGFAHCAKASACSLRCHTHIPAALEIMKHMITMYRCLQQPRRSDLGSKRLNQIKDAHRNARAARQREYIFLHTWKITGWVSILSLQCLQPRQRERRSCEPTLGSMHSSGVRHALRVARAVDMGSSLTHAVSAECHVLAAGEPELQGMRTERAGVEEMHLDQTAGPAPADHLRQVILNTTTVRPTRISRL
jgi:hypothetical protein